MSRSVFRMLYQLIEMVNKMCPALSFEESQVEQHWATLPDITSWVVFLFFWWDYFRFYFVVSILTCRLPLPLFVCFSHSIGLYTCSAPLVHVRADRDSVEITVTECFLDTLNIDVFPYLCVV